MGNCAGSEVTIETIDESSKDLQKLPNSLTRSAIRKSIKRVNLSNNNLKDIDAKFWLNTNLEEIILAGNKDFLIIPDQVATLTKLTKLDLSDTGLKNINNFLWSLPKLSWLSVSKTSITSLGKPNSTSLVHLDISFNALQELPEEISTMVNLKVLKANNNKLATIPKSIGKCTKLKQLYIQSNELKFLPNEANMKQLDVLKISDDQTEDKCELFETIWEGETVLSCTYFNCPNLAPIVPKRIDSLGKDKSGDNDEEETVTFEPEMPTVKAERNMDKPVTVVSAEIEKENISDEAIPDQHISKETVEKAVELVVDETVKLVEHSENAVEADIAQIEKTSDEAVQEICVDESSNNTSALPIVEITKNDTEAVEIEKVAVESVESFVIIDENQIQLETHAEPETTQSANENINQTDETSDTSKLKTEDVDSNIEPVADASVPETTIESSTDDAQLEPETSVNTDDASKSISDQAQVTSEPMVIADKIQSEEVATEEVSTEQNKDIVSDDKENESNSDRPPVSPKPTSYVSEAAMNISTNSNAEQDDEDDQEETESSETHETEIIRHRGMGNVRRSMQMFETVSEESAKPKPSQTKMTRRLSQRTSYRSDQPSQTGSGEVVRVAVPIPENHKEKVTVRAPVKTGRMEPMWDANDNVSVITTIKENVPTIMEDIQHIKPIIESSAKDSTETTKTEVTFQATTSIEVNGDVLEAKSMTTEESTFTFASIKIEENLHQKSPMSSVQKHEQSGSSVRIISQDNNESSTTVNDIVLDKTMIQTIGQVLKHIDFGAEPREVLAKVSRSKGASLGLSIISADEEAEAHQLEYNMIIVKEVLEVDGTKWTGETPNPGDVLESVDGSICNNDTIRDILGECGNLIQLKFQRYPSAFTGYM